MLTRCRNVVSIDSILYLLWWLYFGHYTGYYINSVKCITLHDCFSYCLIVQVAVMALD